MTEHTYSAYWTEQDVADRLHLPPSRVRRLAKDGTIPCRVLPGGDLLFDPTEVLAWVRALPRTDSPPVPSVT